jgi:hypothetical protein
VDTYNVVVYWLARRAAYANFRSSILIMGKELSNRENIPECSEWILINDRDEPSQVKCRALVLFCFRVDRF